MIDKRTLQEVVDSILEDDETMDRLRLEAKRLRRLDQESSSAEENGRAESKQPHPHS